MKTKTIQARDLKPGMTIAEQVNFVYHNDLIAVVAFGPVQVEFRPNDEVRVIDTEEGGE